jgi:hypothetical protein
VTHLLFMYRRFFSMSSASACPDASSRAEMSSQVTHRHEQHTYCCPATIDDAPEPLVRIHILVSLSCEVRSFPDATPYVTQQTTTTTFRCGSPSRRLTSRCNGSVRRAKRFCITKALTRQTRRVEVAKTSMPHSLSLPLPRNVRSNSVLGGFCCPLCVVLDPPACLRLAAV